MNHRKNIGVFFGAIFFVILVLATAKMTFANEITFVPSLSAFGEYDSNITFRRTDEIDDYLGIISPGVVFNYKSELLMIRSRAIIDVYRYFDETDYDTENQYYELEADYKLTERWKIGGSGLYYKDTTLDDFLEETGIVYERKDRKRYDMEANTFYQLTELDEIGLNYQYRNVDFSGKDRVDYDVNSGFLIYNRYFNDRRDILTLRPGYRRADSDRSETDVFLFNVGWQHKISETLRSRAFIGIRYMDISYKDDRSDYDNFGGTADLSLTKSWETTSGTIGYRRDIRGNADGEVVEVDKIYCDIEKQIYGRLGAGFKGRLYFTRQEGNDTPGDDTRFFVLNPSLFYNLTENHLIRLGYSYSNEDDDAIDDDSIADRHRAWIGFEFNFPFKG
jgi:hypothetical protein